MKELSQLLPEKSGVVLLVVILGCIRKILMALPIGINHLASKQIIAQLKTTKPSYHSQVGEKVRIPHLGQTGEVLTIDEDSQLTVRFSLMKMTVSVNEIESLDGQKVETTPKAKTAAAKKSSVAAAKQAPVTVRACQNTLER